MQTLCTARTRNAFSFLALAALLSVQGCASGRSGTQNIYSGSEDVHAIEGVETNSALAADLSIVNPRSQRREDRLVVQFELQNKRSSQMEFAWAVDWYDASGFRVLDATRHWEPVRIGGGGTTTLTITAPTPEATTWKLQVTDPDEVR